MHQREKWASVYGGKKGKAAVGILESLSSPKDLESLNERELEHLAQQIRKFLVAHVSQTGGHLGPNLGVVELTIALHRVFNSPHDSIVFDTGHQAYVHKLLTGRKDFTNLRKEGGLSGYPSRGESEHDIVENSHATTALSWAEGIARSYGLTGQKTRHAVAVIGDGAMTGGMAWEALNNIAEQPQLPLVIVLNDNGRSYAPTIGGMVRRFEPVKRLDSLRVNPGYEQLMEWTKNTLREAGMPGKMAYGALHSIKRGVKDIFVDAGIFDSLGIKYLGPVDGHNFRELEEALTLARNYGGPVVVHAITEKGRGYKPAEDDQADRFHAIGKIHPETGLPVVKERFGWTRVVAEELLSLAETNSKLVGITAAMLRPVGLGPMSEAFPERVIDVGIAEQHALTMAAGLAFGGFHPVVALYATFLNRGFDQLLMDVAMHKSPVSIFLDRAGITGDDGASHHGMWDLSIATTVPGIHLAAPRDEQRLREALRASTQLNATSIVRYPKGSLPAPLASVEQREYCEIVYKSDVSQGAEPRGPKIAVVALGPMAHLACEAARAVSGVDMTVIDPLWALPLREELLAELATYEGIITIEDGIIEGGWGQSLSAAAQAYARSHEAGVIPAVNMGVPRAFYSHAKRDAILERVGLTSAGITEQIEGLARILG